MKKVILLIILSLIIFLSCGKKDKNDEKQENKSEYSEVLEDKTSEKKLEENVSESAIEKKEETDLKDKSIDDIISETLGNGKGNLAILIDDTGGSLELAQEFEALQMNISFAILPYLKKSREVNDYFKSLGYTTLLHLPMEGSDKAVNDNTKDLLKASMSEAEMKDIFDRALENVGPVKGFNNHMGSVFTSSEESMNSVLSFAKDKRLFYVDSRTISSSKGFAVAREKRIPTAQCIHFLDNSKEIVDIERELIRAAKLAQKKGNALVIGHFHKNMVVALRNSKETLTNSGVNLVFVDEILE